MSWEIKTLEELFVKGSSKLTLKAVKDSVGPFKVFGAKGLCGHSNQYDQEQRYFAVIKDGAGVGRISCHEPQSSVLGTMQYLIPRGHENFRFLHYALLNLKLSSFAVGSTIPHIYFKDYKGLNIGVPTFEEQERIVEVLDEAFAAIDKAKANIERNLSNARELFQSRLNDIFSNPSEDWEVKPLGEVCDLQNGFAFKSSSYVESSKTQSIRMSCIRPNGIFDAEHNIRFLPDSFSEEYSDFILNEGDLIIAMTDMAGDPKILGLPTVVKAKKGVCFLMNQRVGRLRDFRKGVSIPFLVHFLSAPLMKEFYKSKGAGGLQLNIGKKDVLSAKISLPQKAEQDRLANGLDEFKRLALHLETKYQTELDNLEELRQSILEQAFKGKLTEPVAA